MKVLACWDSLSWLSALLSAVVLDCAAGGMGGMGSQGGPRRSRPIPGEDERHDINLDFLDAVFGTQ